MADRAVEAFNHAVYWSVPRIQNAMRNFNSFLELFERWQIVLFSLVFGYIIYCVLDFWEHELENGKLKIKIYDIFNND